MPQENDPDRFGVDAGARKLAVDMAIRTLVDHARATDPGIGDRIAAAVDAFVAGLDPQSDLERDFAERARAHAAGLVRPLAG